MLHKAFAGLALVAASSTAMPVEFDFLLPGSVTLTPQTSTTQAVFDLASLAPQYAGRWPSARANSAQLKFKVRSFGIPDPIMPAVGHSSVPVTRISTRAFDAGGVYRIEQDNIYTLHAENHSVPSLTTAIAGNPQKGIVVGEFDEIERRTLFQRERDYDFVPDAGGDLPEIVETTTTSAVYYALSAAQRSLTYDFRFAPGSNESIEVAFDMAFGSASLQLTDVRLQLDIDPSSLADQIPLPPAIWLLGSSFAMVGFAVSRRRVRKSPRSLVS